MYPYMKFPDKTEVLVSDLYENGSYSVVFEQPTDDIMRYLCIDMPSGFIRENVGFTNKDLMGVYHYLDHNKGILLGIATYKGFDGYADSLRD